MASTFRMGGDLDVRRLGFGAMHLPTGPGPDRENALVVARRAVELGVTLIGTAHLYGGGANEELLAEALHPYPEGLLITTKVGVARTGPGGDWMLGGRPEILRDQVRQALRRLRMERIDLLQLHRIDPETPPADQLGMLRELQGEGLVGRIGLSEVTVDELERARELVDVVSVQNRYNLLDREHKAVLDACVAAGIAFLPWRPVAWGGGTRGPRPGSPPSRPSSGPRPRRSHSPGSSTTPPSSCPSRARPGLEENIAAADLKLTPAQRDRLDGLAEAAQAESG
ncbi:aryl-alcohol dehydrogenase-like predicted oxidoreductase [Streptomyces sp. AK010]|nr:aryl-alcohol dehydrogenase-like predicted oxidoreductase [Streptomyces sp. AK010]